MNDTRTVLLIAAAVTLFGCAQRMTYGIGAPVLDSHFGEAVTQARAMQVIRPAGVTVSDRSYSGKSAQTALHLHHAAEKQPAPAPAPSGAAEKNGK